MGHEVLVSQTRDAAPDIDLEREAFPGVGFRCVAYAISLSLLCWIFIFFGIALTTGYMKL